MYESPIEIIYDEIKMHFENEILNAIQHYDIQVDKDELIKALNYDRNQYEKGFKDGAKQEAKWIPVSERLPEDTQPVLMTIRRMSKLYNHKPFVTVGHISWNQTTWWCAHDGDCARNEIEVIAWMPLPEPYKVESEEE